MNMQLKLAPVSYIPLRCTFFKTSSKDNESFEVKHFLRRFWRWCAQTEPPTRVMPLTYPASVFAVTNDGQQVAEIARKKTEDGQREGGGKKKKTNWDPTLTPCRAKR